MKRSVAVVRRHVMMKTRDREKAQAFASAANERIRGTDPRQIALEETSGVFRVVSLHLVDVF